MERPIGVMSNGNAFIGSTIPASPSAPILPGPAGPRESVVLLHGLARTNKSMAAMQARLEREGFQVVNYDYPSRKYPIAELAERFLPMALSQCPGARKIHFVTHSLGGILLRQYLKDRPLPNLGRVVMLGPPNQGSQVVDRLGRVPGFGWINGKAGFQLGTSGDCVPALLGPADFEVGIIAGTRSINLILSLFLPGPNDGKVSVENTKLAGMKEHLPIPVSHPFLMRDAKAIGYTVNFLKTGSFR